MNPANNLWVARVLPVDMLVLRRIPHLAVVLVIALAAEAATAARPIHVALVGDSLAYGAGDEDGKGIAGRLQPELQRRGGGVVVTTNLGANGATTREVGAKLREPLARKKLATADAIVLSMGANDVREALLGTSRGGFPVTLVDEVLINIASAVAELRTINPKARILILGAYAPLPHDRAALLLEPLIHLWDSTLESRFADDPLVSVVRMSDIVDRPERLSTLDSFHPGGEAYQQTAARIAEQLAPRAAARQR